MALIGDIHGDKKYLVPEYFMWNDIQLGDLDLFGYGHLVYDKPRFFLEGNHDHFPSLNCDAEKPYEVVPGNNLFHIPRGYWQNGTLFIGGGFSRDHFLRVEGRDWFQEQEKLSYQQMDRIMNAPYQFVDTIVSHECPEELMPVMFNIRPDNSNPVARDLDAVLNAFNPTRWFFGHHHTTRMCNHKNCAFMCLGIGDRFSFDLKLTQNFQDDFDPFNVGVGDPLSWELFNKREFQGG